MTVLATPIYKRDEDGRHEELDAIILSAPASVFAQEGGIRSGHRICQ
jgi:hypothetical protein